MAETTIIEWSREFDELMGRIGPRYVRSEARKHAAGYMKGLMSETRRKNGWQLAETLGEETPYGIQQFLYRGKWSPEEVRDDLRGYVIEQLADPAGILIVDETGFLKKGDKSAGVGQQYSGTAHGVANCQIGVFLTYKGEKGHTFLDRALYLPESWTADRERCRKAQVPEEVEFATKPTLGLEMIQRAVAGGVPAKWVAGDSVYGSGEAIRDWLETVPLGYVLGITSKDTLLNEEGIPYRVGEIATALREEGWQRESAGQGSQGPRWFEWQSIPLQRPALPGWHRYLLARRTPSDPSQVNYYVCFAPAETSLAQLALVTGSRWSVENCFENAKQEVGLDEYEVRSWPGWYRHITLACLAHAFLTVLRAQGLDPLEAGKKTIPRATQTSLAAFKKKRGLISP